MKYLYCKVCKDFLAMKSEISFCSCKQTSGQYVDDLYAKYSGECIPVAIPNSQIEQAIRKHNEGRSSALAAIFIIDEVNTFRREDA